MKPPRRSHLSFLGETLGYQESEQIPEAKLEAMVIRLREGDKSMINPIIIGHLRLVMGIVADRCSYGHKGQDVEGAAFLALVEAVNNSCPHTNKEGEFEESRLYDNNITYYITTMVRYAIKDEYGSNHTIRMPARTIRDRISKGEKFEDIVPGAATSLDSSLGGTNSHDGVRDRVEDLGMVMPFLIPIAKIEFPSLEFSDALARCPQDETERAIIRFRSMGHTYEETAKLVGLSTPRVGQIIPKIEARFDQLMK